jgi:hypothetical protein
MPKTMEAMASLLIYGGMAACVLIVGSWIWYLRWKKNREDKIFDRKEMILDQYLLRLKEFSLLIEEIWQKKDHK